MTREREQFEKYRDKDHDGKLNHEEIKDWIIPEDYDHSDAEAKHLISSSDSGDKVCMISGVVFGGQQSTPTDGASVQGDAAKMLSGVGT